NLELVRSAEDDALLDRYYRRRRVPPVVVQSVAGVGFDDLPVVNARAEVSLDRGRVAVPSVGRNLKALAVLGRRRGRELGGEDVRVLGRAPADLVSEDYL